MFKNQKKACPVVAAVRTLLVNTTHIAHTKRTRERASNYEDDENNRGVRIGCGGTAGKSGERRSSRQGSRPERRAVQRMRLESLYLLEWHSQSRKAELEVYPLDAHWPGKSDFPSR